MAATTKSATVVTERTAADLSALAWTVVDLDAGPLVTSSTASDAKVYGVLTDNVADGSSTETSVGVQLLHGIIRAKLGATLTEGPVRGGTGGKLVAAATGEYAIGILRKGGVDGDIVEVAAGKFQVV